MFPRLAIFGHWWLRSEELNDVVTRTNQMLCHLGELAPEWSNWHRSFQSLEDRNRPPLYLQNDLKMIRNTFLAGQLKDAKGRIIDDLGFDLSASAGPVNGTGTESSHLVIECCHRTWSAGY